MQFKKAFEDARDNNAKLAGAPPPYTPEEKREESTESEEDEGEVGRPRLDGDLRHASPCPIQSHVVSGKNLRRLAIVLPQYAE